jgi:hypothetical protein
MTGKREDTNERLAAKGQLTEDEAALLGIEEDIHDPLKTDTPHAGGHEAQRLSEGKPTPSQAQRSAR